MSELTQILTAIEAGDPKASEHLLPLVYDELRQLAAQKLAQEKPGQTFQATSLVHEAYLRLVGTDEGVQWNGRGHFFAAAAEAMRRILVENARKKQRIKHGGKLDRVTLVDLEADSMPRDVVALHEALADLVKEDPLAAKVVELRYFAGLTLEEVVSVLGITLYQIRQKWVYSRAWLRDALDL